MSDDPWGALPLPPLFQPDGSIDWSGRPFSRSWSLRRVGWHGTLEAIEHLVPQRSSVLLAASDDEAVSELTLCKALAEVGRLRDDERHLWIVAKCGKWLMEFAAHGSFTFEYVIKNPPALDRETKVNVVFRNPT